MQMVEVKGKFVNDKGVALAGRIKFVPSVIWLDEESGTYPCLAPDMELRDGVFKAKVTRTDQHGVDWYYTVITPIGSWVVKIEDDGPLQLKELLPKRYP